MSFLLETHSVVFRKVEPCRHLANIDLRLQVRRLRDIKDEALEQARQAERGFLDAERERLRLERELRQARTENERLRAELEGKGRS